MVPPASASACAITAGEAAADGRSPGSSVITTSRSLPRSRPATEAGSSQSRPWANSPPGCVYNERAAKRATTMMNQFFFERFGN